MKSTNQTQKQLETENKNLHAQLDEAEETLRAIRSGDWDALVVLGADGEQIFTLKQSELRYRRLFEAAQDGILLLNAGTGAITDVNPFLIKMLGYSREEFVKKKLWEVGAFKDIGASRNAFKELQQNEYIRYENLPLKTKDGRLVQVEFVSNAYLVDDEKVIQCNIRDITERKKVDDALRESEERYRLLMETLPDGVVVHSQGRVVFANPASARLIGAGRADDLTGKLVMDFVHPDYREIVLKRILQSLSDGVPLPLMKEKFLRQDGTPIDVEASAIPFVYAGKPAMLTVFNDITARLQAELALELAYSQLTNLYNNLPEAVFSVDLVQNKMLQVSYAHEAIFGYPTDEFFKNPQLWYEIIIPEDKAIMDASYPLLSMGESVQQQFRILRPDGEMRWIESIIKPNFAENGKLVRFDGIASDITERKRIEEALRESERHYRQMIETAGEGIWSINAENHTTLANKRLAEMFGYSVEEIFEKSIFDFTDEEYQASAQAGLELRKQGISTQLDFKFRRKDGRTLWALIETSSLYDPAGNYTGMLAMLTDITERKQGEEKLRSTREFLQSVQDALSTHIAILDVEGNIVQVNAAWRNFGRQNGLKYADYGIGINYLEICDRAKGLYATEAAEVATAIRDMRDGEKREIWIEYPCHAPGQQRWFVARITSFENNGQKWIVVAHENITERKQIEIEIHRRLNELEVLYQSGLAFSQLIDSKTIAEKIIDLLDQKMDWHHTAIRLYHSESETLELLAFNMPNLNTRVAHSAAEEQLKIMQRPDQGLSGWAIRHSRAVRCNDLKNDLRYFENFPGLQSGLYVPIKIAERVIGVISIESQYMDTFSESDERLIVTLAAQAAIAMDNAHLFNSLKRSNNDLTSAYDATIEGWSRALDLRDKETEGHSQRVTEMTLKLAQAFGLSNEELAQVRWGALLHDIGKMGVPDGILLKPGPLTDDEWITMKKHPTFAYEMLFPIRYLRGALDIPYCHHEKWDGSGYPRGLKGSLIPLSARIFAVVDVYDALSSDRPYRAAWPKEKVREHIRSLSATHFDPQVVDILLESDILVAS